jgi:hypothetical protein
MSLKVSIIIHALTLSAICATWSSIASSRSDVEKLRSLIEQQRREIHVANDAEMTMRQSGVQSFYAFPSTKAGALEVHGVGSDADTKKSVEEFWQSRVGTSGTVDFK